MVLTAAEQTRYNRLPETANYSCMTERVPELDYRYKSSQSFRGTSDNSDVHVDAAKGTCTGYGS